MMFQNICMNLNQAALLLEQHPMVMVRSFWGPIKYDITVPLRPILSQTPNLISWNIILKILHTRLLSSMLSQETKGMIDSISYSVWVKQIFRKSVVSMSFKHNYTTCFWKIMPVSIHQKSMWKHRFEEMKDQIYRKQALHEQIPLPKFSLCSRSY